VAGYNADPSVHGILVQLPLPPHIDEQRVLDAISIEKDVDGFHPLNIGRLAMRGRDPLFVPCTPKGCLELLKRSGVALSGKKAAVVGRSNIVGMPAALLLQREDCTVTVIHSRTANAQRICAEADIVIAACGKAEMVGGDWIKEGAVVIDVGINAVDVSRSCRVGLGWERVAGSVGPRTSEAWKEWKAGSRGKLPACCEGGLPSLSSCLPPPLQDATAKRGYRLVGDVNFAEASEKASLITPVPGGVGPMTIAMLLRNCVDGAARTFAAEA
jgi:5,10-methylene-tetrahydrofolate dehydrogenase/methenyl tetrahydrofolate cyclohydrolase